MNALVVSVKCTKCNTEYSSIVVSSIQSAIACSNCNKIILESNKHKGFIYILSNRKIPGLVKIGFTTRRVEERVEELNDEPGIPEPFIIEAVFVSMNPEESEKNIHDSLAGYRYSPQREFFKISMLDAKREIGKFLGNSVDYIQSRKSEEFIHEDEFTPNSLVKFNCVECCSEFTTVLSDSTWDTLICRSCRTLMMKIKITDVIAVLSNRTMPNVVIIKVLKNHIEEYLANLNGATGVPEPFSLRALFSVAQGNAANIINFNEFRNSSNRDFYNIKIQKFLERLTEISDTRLIFKQEDKSFDNIRDQFESKVPQTLNSKILNNSKEKVICEILNLYNTKHFNKALKLTEELYKRYAHKDIKSIRDKILIHVDKRES